MLAHLVDKHMEQKVTFTCMYMYMYSRSYESKNNYVGSHKTASRCTSGLATIPAQSPKHYRAGQPATQGNPSLHHLDILAMGHEHGGTQYEGVRECC